jgi:hypothetical protein
MPKNITREGSISSSKTTVGKRSTKTASKHGNYGADTFTAAKRCARREVKRALKGYTA